MAFLVPKTPLGSRRRATGCWRNQLDAFMAYRAEATRLAYGVAERRAVARAWNTCAELYPRVAQTTVRVAARRRYKARGGLTFRTVFELRLRLTSVRSHRRNRLIGRARRKACAPRTIATRARELDSLTGKAVSIGTPIASLTSLSVLLHPDLVARVVNAYWDDDGEVPKPYTIDLPWRLHVIARATGCLRADELEQLANVRAAAQEHRRPGLTEKNRQLIRAVKSTNVWQRVCRLPEQLMCEARRERPNNPLRAAMKAQVAVAIAILTIAPVRIGNLVRTRLDEHLFRVGGPHGCYWLRVPASRGQELRRPRVLFR